MKLPKRHLRTLLSFALVMTVTTLFTLRSYAAIETKSDAGNSASAQDCTGTLTIKRGTVTVNGNAAQTGATVMTGSVIATSGSGNAIIDLGAAGRIEVKGNTAVTITCAGGAAHVRTNCSKTEVETKSGQLNVTSPATETIAAGQGKHYNGAMEADLAAGASIEVECEGRKGGGALLVGPGLLGLLALLGVGAAVAAGIAVGNGDTTNSGVLPASPSR